MTEVPDFHHGVPYYNFIGDLSRIRGTDVYFEIGVNEGKLMSYIHAKKAVGVDPDFVLSSNVAAYKQQTHLVAAASDAFFACPEMVAALGSAPDLCFLDGFHTFEFLLRDFYKTEQLCSKRSLIILHDCLPLDDIMTIRRLSDWQSKTIGTKWQGSWTGDVWKVIPILQKHRPDLRIAYVDCPPTGLVCIANLDSSSRVLQENYFSIVDSFKRLENNAAEIERLYASIEITSSAEILAENDHTLFFGA